MPVKIFDIPQEEKIATPPPSLWIWGSILVCTILSYMYLFLIHFPQYLSKNSYIFWPQLLVVPLLIWGGAFLFRITLWNNENIEVKYWNTTRTDYHQELLNKGRNNLEIIDLQIRLPDTNGNEINSVGNTLLPMRYTPKLTHISRYLLFSSPERELKTEDDVEKRKKIIFNQTANELINNIHMHLTLLPLDAIIKIVCVLEESLVTTIETIWEFRFGNTPFSKKLEFSINLSESIDSWLDEPLSEYIILISASFYSNALLNDEVDSKSESIAYLLGRKKNSNKNEKIPFGQLYRPEYDWAGIDKSLLWGAVPDDKKLSGVVYSGLSEEESNKVVLKTAEFMSESSLSSFRYLDTTDIFCKSPPLTEILQLNYINEHLAAGSYIIINRQENVLVSYFFNSTGNKNGDLEYESIFH